MAKNRRISNSLLTQDLMSLIKLLDKYHFTDDIMSKYPLENLLNIRQTGKLTDNVQIDDIAFKLKTDSWNTSPYVNDAVLTASLSYKYIENLENIEKDGLFSHYQLEFLLRGEGNDNKNHMFSWHLDREECIEGTFHHPLYHFHSGGHKIKDCDKGDLIIIGSPRLAHPPMDVFLMIHFIIALFPQHYNLIFFIST